jgi:uncharacterized protein involved in exopolysaccharide biosynthesis
MKRLALLLFIIIIVSTHAAERTATMRIDTTVTQGQMTNQPYLGEYYADAQISTLESESFQLHAAQRSEMPPTVISSVDSIKADYNRATSIISITVKCADSRLAADVANAIMDAYIEYIHFSSPTEPTSIETLIEQAERLQEEILKLEQEGNSSRAESLKAIVPFLNGRIQDKQNGIDDYTSTIEVLKRAED